MAIALQAMAARAQTIQGTDGRLYSRSQVEAFLAFCSKEADARGLHVKEGFRSARRAFRRECMHKLEIDPQH